MRSAEAEGSPPLPDKPSIAVLPFENMSGDPSRNILRTEWLRKSSRRSPAGCLRHPQQNDVAAGVGPVGHSVARCVCAGSC
jgi:hypothetical protein